MYFLHDLQKKQLSLSGMSSSRKDYETHLRQEVIVKTISINNSYYIYF